MVGTNPLPQILHLLAPRLAKLLERALLAASLPVEEIRIRLGRPLQVVEAGGDHFVASDGRLTPEPGLGFRPDHDDLDRTFQLMSRGSVYAWEDEIRNGFLTLPGGHRVGLAGRAVTAGGSVQTFKQIASLNLRLARDVPGSADKLLPGLIRGGRLLSTLLISPPQAGKTTVLRDLVRQVSIGIPDLGLSGRKVGLVDERSEVACCHDGVPQRDVGPRTDVLDGCPKAEGMMLLIRAMSPQVLAVDEIGRPADAEAVFDALHAGVAVIATAHGATLSEVQRRPALKALLEAGAFERAAVLGRSRGPGTLEQLLDLRAAPLGADAAAGGSGGGRLAG